jgi:glyoxylase-like metal-dependent hydrolase (beta-lactamase superfamily II)
MIIARRHAIATGIAATATPMFLRPAAAQEAEAVQNGQAPAFYRLKVGALEVVRVHDGFASRPLDASFVGNAELADVQAALAAIFQPTDTLAIPFTTTVLRTPQHTVLIDTSLGEFAPPTAGMWRRNLAAAGIDAAQVDTIVVSHFHGDHIGGIRGKDGTLAFPNARVMVPEAEWAFWMDDGQMSRAPEAMQPGFQNVRRVFAPMAGEIERFTDGQELVPGLRVVAATGHTPGHSAFLVSDGDDRLLVWSDTTNKPELFVANPTWQAVFDMDGAQAAATRLRLLDMAAAERLLVAGYHFPFPATGYIARSGTNFAYVPMFWRATL